MGTSKLPLKWFTLTANRLACHSETHQRFLRLWQACAIKMIASRTNDSAVSLHVLLIVVCRWKQRWVALESPWTEGLEEGAVSFCFGVSSCHVSVIMSSFSLHPTSTCFFFISSFSWFLRFLVIKISHDRTLQTCWRSHQDWKIWKAQTEETRIW